MKIIIPIELEESEYLKLLKIAQKYLVPTNDYIKLIIRKNVNEELIKDSLNKEGEEDAKTKKD
jgi:hypothetical protein